MEHIPVLLEESLNMLNVKKDGIYLDMTLGGFGHGREICKKLGKEGLYIGLDKDQYALTRANENLGGLKCRTHFVKSDFCDFKDVLDDLEINTIDGCLMDLGVSSFQIDDAKRGFSFMKDGPLDMRMDTSESLNAAYVVNNYSEDEIKTILQRYGEEKYALSIARGIVRERKEEMIETTSRLADVVKKSIPPSYLYSGKNPAAKTFQALRIEVNNELEPLKNVITEVIDVLNKNGRLCVISFHSLEDRIVKHTFIDKAQGCTCPKDFPICVCGKTPQIKILTKNPIIAKEEELKNNIRSRSAKLRAAQKL